MINALLSALAPLVLLFQSGCKPPSEEERENLTVAVSILPQKYFVEKIAGDSINIVVVVPPGANPATYEPSPSDMRNMSSADVWLTIGVAFESPWIPRFTGSNPGLRIRSTIENIERLPIDRYTVTGHETSGHHGHGSGSPDPHVWLSPELVRSQAALICEELSLIESARADEYMANLNTFYTEIDSLQSTIQVLIDPLPSRSFIVFHPAWGYFADEFDLIQIPIETAGSEPSPREMSLLIDYACENDVSAVFVSPQFSTSSAASIAAEIGVGVSYIDPLAEDWSSNLLEVAELLSGLQNPE